MANLRKQGTPLLVLDSGNLLSPVASTAAGKTDQARGRARLLLDCYAKIGCDGLGLGPLDLTLGLAFLKEEASRLACPILSANLVEKGSGKPVFQRSAIREAGGLRVALFSVTNPEDLIALPEGERGLVEARDPVESAKDVAKELAEKADVVILLSLLGEMLDERIVRQVPEIDFVLEGTRGLPPRPDWNLPEKSGPAGAQGTGVAEAATPEQEEARSDPQPMAVVLRPPDDRGKLVNRIDIEVREKGAHGRLADASSTPPRSTEGNTYSLRSEQMSTRLADEPGVKGMVEEAKSRFGLSQPTAPAPAPRPSPGASLDAPLARRNEPDTRECAGCHASQAAFWAKTAHAPGGPGASGAPRAACPACHAVVLFHERPAAPRSRVTESVCRTCHTAERDADFDLARDLAAIACPSARPAAGWQTGPARFSP